MAGEEEGEILEEDVGVTAALCDDVFFASATECP